MASKLKKGEKLLCIPCGREIVVSSAGISKRTIWCCGRPMGKGSPLRKAAPGKKNRIAGKKTAGKKK